MHPRVDGSEIGSHTTARRTCFLETARPARPGLRQLRSLVRPPAKGAGARVTGCRMSISAMSVPCDPGQPAAPAQWQMVGRHLS
ncbi:hypothetical protein IFM12275_35550 [Nocardia sputorum]|nr:hypothetical protein IFM12275_35550 [Nocardia sputorum]